MTLQDWLRNGWLTEHETSAAEIAAVLGMIGRDLHDCEAEGLSPDWRLSIAYNAALQVALAGLAVCGYRVARESHHYRAIQSLDATIGCKSGLISQLDAFRKKRNISDYERAGGVSRQEADEMVALARQLRAELLAWLRQHHPELLPCG